MSRNLTVQPKFITAYEKLFNCSATQLSAFDEDQFWFDFFSLDVDKTWLAEKLQSLSREDCLGLYKHLLNILFRRSLSVFSTAGYDDPRRRNCLETLILFVLVGLSKQMSGWEVMEVFAGGVGESDAIFSDFTRTIDEVLGDGEAPIMAKLFIWRTAEIRHRTLQLAIVFACGINQLSPGAYLLRRDLYPSLVSVILSREMQQFTFEATLLLSVLSNFHKSDSAKTNPYLNQIKESTDTKLMERINWIITFAAQRAVIAYQEISNDSPPTLATAFGTFISSLRPDRALSSTPIDPPRELFKNQPIEAAVMLLPFHDLLRHNGTFRRVFSSTLASRVDETEPMSNKPPAPHAILSLSSYLVTHASSTASSRALAYAYLALSTLLICVEERDIVSALYQPLLDGIAEIRLCRQRQPFLPFSSSPQPPICALLDCCVLWLRHNLHKRLDVFSYITSIRIIHRTVWFATVEHIRLEYHWGELWRSLLLLLDFVTNQVGTLKSVSKIDDLLQEAIHLLDFSICFGERFLPTPQALHQLVYELVRSASTFAKQTDLLMSLTSPKIKQQSAASVSTQLQSLQRITGYYENKLVESKAQTAEAAMRLITKEIDQEGVWGVEERTIEDLSRYSDYVTDHAFSRWACTDGLALMRE